MENWGGKYRSYGDLTKEEIDALIDSPEFEAVMKRVEERRDEAMAALVEELERRSVSAVGRRGGIETAKRGPEYYRELQGKRKVRNGGRPRREK
jgi:hypothetical protein